MGSRCENAVSASVQQRKFVALYDDQIVGEKSADLPVEDNVIVERKGVAAPSDIMPRNAGTVCGRRTNCLRINIGRPTSKSAASQPKPDGDNHPLHPPLSP